MTTKQPHLALILLLFIILIVRPAFAQTLTIAIGDYPPYSGEKLKGQGLIPQVIRAAFAQHNIRVDFQFMPWARSFMEAKKGQYDASAYWYCTESRQAHFSCSMPLYEESAVFFFNKSNPVPSWNTLAELENYRIGATRGYSYTDEFWRLANSGDLNVNIMTRDEQNFSMLLKGRIDLFPIGLLPGQYLLEKNYHNEKNALNYLPKPLLTGTLHLLFLKNQPTSMRLLSIFDDGLAKIKRSGEYHAILAQYHNDPTLQPPSNAP
ncbi:transporter substrate-binding domain-containing protein [Pseudoalteromonas sp. SMS1]|uniref:substrate-binding periplasmic protein n=1 Tax=Pseudoalteromonas sp. SMS1 TaxID=2908894 RepID=UPI001F1D002F|nr:transporter substrate-binding domain-containing protein [Pseudoalteromonas sp. SMS1]MCF2859752.1 transporter substrate-binding domain-containing protein [Pseudoalteromonas sp. SMS1]